MSEIKNCPFCGYDGIYETIRTDELGTELPVLFCNICKMSFEVENDSPYMDDKKTFEYLRKKQIEKFNTRKPMQDIVEMLEEHNDKHKEKSVKIRKAEDKRCYDFYILGVDEAIEIVKEVGGLNE